MLGIRHRRDIVFVVGGFKLISDVFSCRRKLGIMINFDVGTTNTMHNATIENDLCYLNLLLHFFLFFEYRLGYNQIYISSKLFSDREVTVKSGSWHVMKKNTSGFSVVFPWLANQHLKRMQFKYDKKSIKWYLVQIISEIIYIYIYI